MMPQLTHMFQWDLHCDTHCTSGIMNTLKLDQEPQVKTIVNIDMATMKAAAILETAFLPKIAYGMAIIQEDTTVAVAQTARVGTTNLMAMNINMDIAAAEKFVTIEFAPIWFRKVAYELKVLKQVWENIQISHTFSAML